MYHHIDMTKINVQCHSYGRRLFVNESSTLTDDKLFMFTYFVLAGPFANGIVNELTVISD